MLNYPYRFIDDSMQTVDCGDEVGVWLDKVLGEPECSLRLLYHPITEAHRSGTDVPEPWRQNCKPHENVSFSIWYIVFNVLRLLMQTEARLF